MCTACVVPRILRESANCDALLFVKVPFQPALGHGRVLTLLKRKQTCCSDGSLSEILRIVESRRVALSERQILHERLGTGDDNDEETIEHMRADARRRIEFRNRWNSVLAPAGC